MNDFLLHIISHIFFFFTTTKEKKNSIIRLLYKTFKTLLKGLVMWKFLERREKKRKFFTSYASYFLLFLSFLLLRFHRLLLIFFDWLLHVRYWKFHMSSNIIFDNFSWSFTRNSFKEFINPKRILHNSIFIMTKFYPANTR